MACLANLNNFAASCSYFGKGGVRAIILALRSSVTDVVKDGRTIVPSFSSSKRLPFKGSFQSVAQVDENTGQQHFRDELAGFIQESHGDSGTNLEAFAAAGPDDLVILVETWNGQYFILGYAWKDAAMTEIISAPLFFNGGQLFTGTEVSDGNGWNVNLVSVHPLPAARSYADEDTNVSNPSTD